MTDDDLIKASDFSSVKLTFGIANTTTKTGVKKGAVVRLVELAERGMVLEVPVKTCAKGHNLMLNIVASMPDAQPVQLLTTGKVDEVETLPDGVDHVTLTFVQYDEDQWEAFQRMFSSRQEQILEFLKAAKGM